MAQGSPRANSGHLHERVLARTPAGRWGDPARRQTSALDAGILVITLVVKRQSSKACPVVER
jgi:hypothetical protein